jgi:hypothetical protein
VHPAFNCYSIDGRCRNPHLLITIIQCTGRNRITVYMYMYAQDLMAALTIQHIIRCITYLIPLALCTSSEQANDRIKVSSMNTVCVSLDLAYRCTFVACSIFLTLTECQAVFWTDVPWRHPPSSLDRGGLCHGRINCAPSRPHLPKS